jgi:hypothetical protein
MRVTNIRPGPAAQPRAVPEPIPSAALRNRQGYFTMLRALLALHRRPVTRLRPHRRCRHHGRSFTATAWTRARSAVPRWARVGCARDRLAAAAPSGPVVLVDAGTSAGRPGVFRPVAPREPHPVVDDEQLGTTPRAGQSRLQLRLAVLRRRSSAAFAYVSANVRAPATRRCSPCSASAPGCGSVSLDSRRPASWCGP